MSIEFIGSFESCYMPQHDVDILETSEHTLRWVDDLALLRSCGITRLRYPVRWHRIETEPGHYDWGFTDATLGYLHANGFRPIVDLLHHCSYPRWLDGGFADPRFGDAYRRYCEAFAERYPWVPEYTLLNEPFTTLFLTGHEGIWPPYGRGMESFVGIARNVLPALGEVMRMYRHLLPEADHVYVEPCEGHSASQPSGEVSAALANDRRFFVLDVLTGVAIDPDRPFVRRVVEAGGEDLLGVEGAPVDILGLDYYAHLEWSFADETAASCPSPKPHGLAALVLQYWERYGLPMIIGETNIRGFASDRATWLKYTLEQCEIARGAGAPLTGYCWFPFVDSLDWDSLLANADRHVDPVGVFWLDENLDRRGSVMSAAFCHAASGAPSRQLPAFRFQPPLDRWLRGLMPQMSHWEWADPILPGDGMSTATTAIHSAWEVSDAI